MAKASIQRISMSDIDAYRMPDLRPNPGVVSIMGIANGRGAYRERHKEEGRVCNRQPPVRHARRGAVQRRHYADPECFHYPVRTRRKPGESLQDWIERDRKFVRRALSYYGRYKGRYSPRVRSMIEANIARAAKAVGQDSPKAMEYRRKHGLDPRVLKLRRTKSGPDKAMRLAANWSNQMVYPALRKVRKMTPYYKRNVSAPPPPRRGGFAPIPRPSSVELPRFIEDELESRMPTRLYRPAAAGHSARQMPPTPVQVAPVYRPAAHRGATLRMQQPAGPQPLGYDSMTGKPLYTEGQVKMARVRAAKHAKAMQQVEPMPAAQGAGEETMAKKRKIQKSRGGTRRRASSSRTPIAYDPITGAPMYTADQVKMAHARLAKYVKSLKTESTDEADDTGAAKPSKSGKRSTKRAKGKSSATKRTKGKVKRTSVAKKRTRKLNRNPIGGSVLDIFKIGAVALGGFALHRLLTKPVAKLIKNETAASIATAAAGVLALTKVPALSALSDGLSAGVLVSAGAQIAKSLAPDFANTVGLGEIESADTSARYSVAGFQQAMAGGPYLQAAAGGYSIGADPILQAAAGEYYALPSKGIGEYISRDLHSGGQVGEYQVRKLDVLGDTGAYELSPMYDLSSVPTYDGVKPDSAESFLEAMAGIEDVDTYIPREPASTVPSSESAMDAGIFDAGNVLNG